MQIQNGIFDLHKFIIIFRYYRTGVFNPTYPFTAARIAITIVIIMNAPASFTLLKPATSRRKSTYRIIFQMRTPVKTMPSTIPQSMLFQNNFCVLE